MSNHISHAALPYPVKNARFTVLVPYLDADGDPTDPTTPDTEVSQDAGAFADAAEEVTTISGSNGGGYITLTGAETNNSAVMVAFKVASGPKATLMTLHPRVLPILLSGTASAGASGSITLAAGAYDLTGCIVRTTGGTGGGGTGGANNQARMITAYNTSTLVATVVPNWETTPDNTTTYDVMLTDLAVNSPVGRFLRPTTDGRTLVVDSSGLADANAVKVGPTGSGTAQTAADVGANTAAIKTKTDFHPSATAGAAGGLFIAGTNAPVTITGSGDALTLSSTGGNGTGLAASGNGTGHGFKATGGATGDGARLAAGATSGDGLRATGGADGHGARFNSGSAASNYGILAAGNGSTGAGIFAQQTAGNGDGLKASGLGTGSGLKPTGGATGHGILATGGATSGDGANFTGGALGDGIQATGTGGEKDIRANIFGNLTGLVDWNPAWDAEVESEVTDALNVYDPPTRAELTSDINSVLAALAIIDDYVDTEIATIIAQTTAAAIRAAVGLAAADLDTQIGAIPTANENATALMQLSDGVEPGVTPQGALRVIISATAGKSSGHAAGTPKYRDVNDSKNRIDAVTDADGNRTTVTLDMT